jgi:amino acid transporter
VCQTNHAPVMPCVQVIATYLLPLMVGTAVTASPTVIDSNWKLGYFGHIANLVGGPALAIAVTVSAAVSQVGMFEAEMSSDSYQVLGMAERGYLPRSFGTRSVFGTPVVGILLSSLGIVSMLVFSFMEIVELLNAAYCLAELLEFAAFVWLRISQPEMRRGYRCTLPSYLDRDSCMTEVGNGFLLAGWVQHTPDCRAPTNVPFEKQGNRQIEKFTCQVSNCMPSRTSLWSSIQKFNPTRPHNDWIVIGTGFHCTVLSDRQVARAYQVAPAVPPPELSTEFAALLTSCLKVHASI